jgi:hypothetical protein
MDMLYLRNSLLFLALAVVSLTITAEEVYKSVDENGVVSFSDTPTPAAQVIEVTPNVVDVTPVSPVARSPEANSSASEPEVAAESAPQIEEVYTDDNRNPREAAVRGEIHNDASPQPVHAEPAHNGGRAPVRGKH